MATMDIFRNRAFRMIEFTDAVQTAPYLPQRLGQMGLFTQSKPIRTVTVGVEERGGELTVIPTSERGAPPPQGGGDKRNIRDFRTVRIAKSDTIYAHEIQDIKAFGSETELMQVQEEIGYRMSGPTGLLNQVEVTHEHMRLGAVQGVVYDADGETVIIDWFEEWGIDKPATIYFNLGVYDPENPVLRTMCNQVVRSISRSTKMGSIPTLRVHAMAGDNYWDKFTSHPEVRETYKFTQAAGELRRGNAWETFDFGGITWENYRGTDDESTVAVPSDEAIFFPAGVPGLFEVAYSPGEFLGQVNKPGQRVYAMIVEDKDRGMWVKPEVYSYPLFICKRPQSLRRGHLGAGPG
jgi:Phage major capsid protein E